MFDAIFTCSAVLLKGLELRYGRHSARLRRPGQLAYDEARRFVGEVGEGAAMIAAHRALNPNKKEKKGRIKWL